MLAESKQAAVSSENLLLFKEPSNKEYRCFSSTVTSESINEVINCTAK